MCNGQEDIADRIFEAVDWQHPETYLEEQWAEELAECLRAGNGSGAMESIIAHIAE